MTRERSATQCLVQVPSRVWVPPWASKARGGAAQALRCSICKAVLPTLHLLDIHISELHDSFFAAQASRRMEVCPTRHSCLLSVSILRSRRKSCSTLLDWTARGMISRIWHPCGSKQQHYLLLGSTYVCWQSDIMRSMQITA